MGFLAHAAADDGVDALTLEEVGHILVAMQAGGLDQALGALVEILFAEFIDGEHLGMAEMLEDLSLVVGDGNSDHLKAPFRYSRQ